MKVSVFVEPKPIDAEVFFRLRQNTDSVTLMAVDHEGIILSSGNLLSIHSDGRLQLHRSVSRKLGFQLNDHNQLKPIGD